MHIAGPVRSEFARPRIPFARSCGHPPILGFPLARPPPHSPPLPALTLPATTLPGPCRVGSHAMRSLLSSFLLLCGMTASAFAQTPDAYRASRPVKVEGMGTPLAPPSSGVTGYDCSNPIVIESLPYAYTENTCSFLIYLEGTCGGTGPEVVYAFT